ncbi:villin-2-like, partial [Phalaenopsis equestris]
SNEKPNSTNQSGPTQRASALAALSSAFNPSSKSAATGPKPIRSSKGGSQRAAAVAALSSVLTAEQKKAQSEGSTHRHSRTSSPDSTAFESFKIETATSETEDPVEVAAVKVENEVDGFESESNGTVAEVNQDSFAEDKNGEKTFSYERLKAKSSNPVTGIDYKRREAYLSDVEFQTVLGMTKDAFYLQPKWKQDMQKRKVDLF